MNIEIKTAIILVDFYNLFKKGINEFQQNEFERFFKNIISDVIKDDDNLNKIIIRLYGGWYTGYELNNKASEILKIITNINVFPYLNHSKMIKINGSIELAYSLFAKPDYHWKNTLQEKQGLPNLRIVDSSLTHECESNKDICPIKIMRKFTKSKNKICPVEGCTSKNENVFISLQQKMVDTIITCDLITFAENENALKIILISDDTDFFPPLVLSSSKINDNQSLTIAIKNEYNFENYKSILTQFGINVKLHQYD